MATLTTYGALFVLGHGRVEMAAPVVMAVAAAGLGSLAPDIDHPNALIANRIPGTLFGSGLTFLLGFGLATWYVSAGGATGVGAALLPQLLNMTRPFVGWAWLSLVIGLLLLATAKIVAGAVEHRGPTHSLSVGAVLTVIVCCGFAVAGQPVALGLWFGWGYLSHLLTDGMTSMGCPSMFWPWQVGGVRVGRPRWSSAGEIVVYRSSDSEREFSARGVALSAEEVAVEGGKEPPLDLTGATTLVPKLEGKLEQHEAPAASPALTGSARICPKCGHALVMREARRGAHAGHKFFGCSNYPRCRHIEELPA